MIVVGASLGGMRALISILAELPSDFPFPVSVVLHRGKESSGGLIQLLETKLKLRVVEVADKEPIRPATVYIAPPDYHLLVDSEDFNLTVEPPVNHARPSIDVLFESAADVFGHKTLAVVLTGASRDGAQGAAAVAARGGVVIVQEPSTAESPIMPAAAIAAVPSARIETLQGISTLLMNLTSRAH